MRIKTIEPIAISLPMKKPVKMAGETVTRADNILVRIETDDGAVGWGEAASAPTMTGETVASMMAAVTHMAPGLLKHPADDFAGAAAAMDAQMYGNSGAKAAIEIALHDLVGRAKGLPLHALFGGKRRERIPLLAVIGSDDAAADLREAQERRNAGYVIYKIKVGVDAPEADAARTQDICRVLGKDCLISADANQGWSARRASATCARLPMRASAFSSSRFTPTISPAWRESPRRAAFSSAPTRAFIPRTISNAIMPPRPLKA